MARQVAGRAGVLAVARVAAGALADSAAGEILAAVDPAVVGEAVPLDMIKLSYDAKESLCAEVG